MGVALAAPTPEEAGHHDNDEASERDAGAARGPPPHPRPADGHAPLSALQLIGFCHMRIADGVGSRLQLSGLLADLCAATLKSMA